jgi:hypothetical protein
MIWSPKACDVGRVWGLRLSGNELVFLVSLRFDALLQMHTAPEARYRERCIQTERWMVGGDRLGIEGVFERRRARQRVEYRLAIDHLTSATMAHAVVTFAHCFRVLDLFGDETLGMEVSDPQHWWVEYLQLAGLASALQVSVTPSAAQQIAQMDERSFQLIVPVILGVRNQTLGPAGAGLVRVERGTSRTPYLMIDGDCTCFGAGGEVFQPGRGYELSSHNFRHGTHLFATLVALAHLSTVMDNTRTN